MGTQPRKLTSNGSVDNCKNTQDAPPYNKICHAQRTDGLVGFCKSMKFAAIKIGPDFT
jgi:hypothetical protein